MRRIVDRLVRWGNTSGFAALVIAIWSFAIGKGLPDGGPWQFFAAVGLFWTGSTIVMNDLQHGYLRREVTILRDQVEALTTLRYFPDMETVELETVDEERTTATETPR